MRASAFETDDGALRCYLDQLPCDRCVFCAKPTAPRVVRVASPVHSWSSGGATHYHQVRGRVSIAVCTRCVPLPWIPLGLGVVVGGAAIAVAYIAGIEAIWYVFGGLIGAMTLFAIALSRLQLRVGEIDEDDRMFKLKKLDPGVVSEVLALGSAPHPRAPLPTATLRAG